MSDWAALADYLARLPEGRHPDDGVEEVGSYRVVVATDWSNIVLGMTVLRAYAAMIPRCAPVTLVFAVPHRPGIRDDAALGILVEKLAAPTAPIILESFDEAARRPAVVAFVPGGDAHVLLSEVGKGLAVLHWLADLVRDPHALRGSPPPRRGTLRGLRERLDGYRELPGPA